MSKMEDFAPRLQRELRAKYAHLMVQWYEMIDWTEPLIVGLISLHVVLFTVVFLTRHQFYLQLALFLAIMMLLFVTESLNSWARTNWKLLATQQYFDQRGIFIGIFYAAPLLALGFFQLLLTMKSMVSLIIQVKRAELKQRMRAKQE